MKRTGLGRHGRIEENAGDPLDGLVNLFDLGMVLAVAFLLAGLGLALHARSGNLERRHAAAGRGQVIPAPTAASPRARGRGEPAGRVYRLPDGRLVYVRGGAAGDCARCR